MHTFGCPKQFCIIKVVVRLAPSTRVAAWLMVNTKKLFNANWMASLDKRRYSNRQRILALYFILWRCTSPLFCCSASWLQLALTFNFNSLLLVACSIKITSRRSVVRTGSNGTVTYPLLSYRWLWQSCGKPYAVPPNRRDLHPELWTHSMDMLVPVDDFALITPDASLCLAGVFVSSAANATSFNDFLQVKPYFQDQGEGAFCIPLDFSANSNGTGLTDGQNVTIQVIHLTLRPLRSF